MLIAQISDFHVVAPGRRAYGRLDTGSLLRRAVALLNGINPQPDLVIGSGDLAQSGDTAEYEEVTAILAGLRAPFAPAAGNHDHRGRLRAAFPSRFTSSDSLPFLQYAVPVGTLEVIILDSVTEGSDEASFCTARAAWLDQHLAGSVGPCLLVTHHPPFRTGIAGMDPPTLDWTIRLGHVIADHPGKVVGIMSGHIHRAIHTSVFGVPSSSCPSTAHQVVPDFGATDLMFSEEAPGFQLHRWEDECLRTYTASFERFDVRFRPAG